MLGSSTFPLRQKIIIGLTIITGLLLLICSQFNLLSKIALNKFILFYGIGVPLMLLMFDSIIDLNNKIFFRISLAFASLTFIISLLTQTDKYLVPRSPGFDKSVGVNYLIAEHSTSSLKSWLIFLIVYWLINKWLNKKGLYVINTFRQIEWYHDIAKRNITWLDVVINFFLSAVIIIGGLFVK